MRELLTAQETTKILGLRTTTQLYKIVDFFDSDPEDEWDLVEGEHFEFGGTSGGEKKRKFYEEGVEAIAEYLDKDTPAIIKSSWSLANSFASRPFFFTQRAKVFPIASLASPRLM